jgi:KWG Leptospira.
MKMLLLRKLARRSRAVMACLLMFFLLTTQGMACSWDYLIWMNRSPDADTLYRFLKDGKAGYINRAGKVVIKPQLESSGNYGGEFHEGLLKIAGDSKGQYIDSTGKTVIIEGVKEYWDYDFSEGLVASKSAENGKWGFVDRTGEFVISPRFDDSPNNYVGSFSEGLAAIMVGQKYGYIDRSGEFVIPQQFLEGGQFHEGLARVIVEGPCVYWEKGPCPGAVTIPRDEKATIPCKFTFIDKSGSVISAPGYDYARDFSEGLAAVQLGRKWGYIDAKGNMVIEPQFESAEPFSDGMARVKRGELWGYIDSTGKIAIRPQFMYAEDFADGLAVVGSWNEKERRYDEYYYINRQGVQAISQKFILASPFFKGRAHVKLKMAKPVCSHDSYYNSGAFAYIDVTGKKIFTYSNCEDD